MNKTMKRNPFFLPSGFEPQEIINILENKGDNKKRLDKIKERKRGEKKLHKQAKHPKKSTKKGQIEIAKNLPKLLKKKKINVDELAEQIQHGYDLATKWGWDGINRPYTPVIISVFGGSKRRHG